MIRINMIRPTPQNLLPLRPALLPAPLPLLTLEEALQESTFLHRAARLYKDDFYVMSDGGRFWTCNRNFTGMYVTEYNPDRVQERTEKLWRPVVGDQTGWRLA